MYYSYLSAFNFVILISNLIKVILIIFFSIQISWFCDFGKIYLNNTNIFIRLSEYFHLLVLYCDNICNEIYFSCLIFAKISSLYYGNICTFLVWFLLKFRLIVVRLLAFISISKVNLLYSFKFLFSNTI